MIGSKKVVVVMPAYNAEATLERTIRDIPPGAADLLILCDDCSADRTVEIARQLGITVYRQPHNMGYGANQKRLYDAALATGADIIVMVHPDYQYDPRVIPFAAGFIASGICDVVMGNRIRTRRETLAGGMPVYKYIANRFLTLVENIVLGQNLGDFHSGFRVYSRRVLETVNFHANSNDFIFDTEFLAQAVHHGFRIGDIPVPTRYFPGASSINFRRSLKYGLHTLWVLVQYLLQGAGIRRYAIFADGRRRD